MSADDGFLTLTHATERDVDLLLIEELKCSEGFVRWLVTEVGKRIGVDLGHTSSSVSHSKRRIYNRREIDITLELVGAAGRTTFLIENKLDTGAQPLQAESYAEEIRDLVSTGSADRAFSILIAPAAYLASAPGFSAKFSCSIAYEDISANFRQRASQADGELASRLSHRTDILEQAITKARRGYQAVPLVQIEAFNAKYVALLTSAGIDLEPGPSMLKEGRPGESKTMIFSPSALPKWPCLPQTRLVHQLREGNANINLYGWGDHFSHLAQILAPVLVGTVFRPVPTVNKRIAGKSGLMIVADTPSVDNLEGFDAQREAIMAGMKTTKSLQAWFLANRATFEICAARVDELEASAPR